MTMLKYIKNHWNGSLTPAKAFWISAFLLPFLVSQIGWLTHLLITACLWGGDSYDSCLDTFSRDSYFIIRSVRDVGFIVIAVWGAVGLFRTPIKRASVRLPARAWAVLLLFLALLTGLNDTPHSVGVLLEMWF